MHDVLRPATDIATVPGAVGAVVTARDGVVWSGASGVRDTGTGAPMADDTVFWIASMTKPIVSIAAMQLVDEGVLSLDAPVSETLPALAGTRVIDAAARTLRPPRTPVTLRHLLSHTSGYAYPRWDADLSAALRELDLPVMARSWDDLSRTPLVADPGTRWSYGIGIDVVGKMIEAATGQSLDQAIEARVCGPLGMDDTRFVLTEAQRARAAPIHVREGSAWVQAGPVGGREMGFLAGGGGMYGTVPDYVRLLRELLAGAPRLLSPAAWDAMGTNQIGALEAGVLRTADAGQSAEIDLRVGPGAKWSLGFMLNTNPMPGRRGAGGQFWAGLANTYFWLDAPAGLAGVLMMSVLPFGDPAPLGLFEAFERAAYAAYRPAAAQPATAGGVCGL